MDNATPSKSDTPLTDSLMKYTPSDELVARVDRNFTYQPPKADQIPRYEALRRGAQEIARRIIVMTPPSREQALALTKLEEAVMHANAAIARHE